MSRSKGNLAEEKACDFLCQNDFVIVDRNFYSRFGEIDIIAKKDEVLHFIEVKSGLDYESAIQNITPAKLNKIIKTLHVYMKKNNLENEFMLDAIVVTPLDVQMIENISI